MTRREVAAILLGILAGFLLARGCTDEPAGARITIRVAPATTTTTTTRRTVPAAAQRTAPTPPASVSRRGETTSPASGGDRLRSTAYCLTGGMASGRRTYVGAVASNRYRLGTALTINPNPWGDPTMRFTVEDRHAPGATELDFAMPGECDRALRWGNRQHVTARIVE